MIFVAPIPVSLLILALWDVVALKGGGCGSKAGQHLATV
jgi:hypothetical protein